MNCRECQDLLQRRLDGEVLPASEELNLHLAGCIACRQNQAAATLLLDGLKSLTYRAPRPDFTKSLVAAVIHDRQVRRQRMRTRWAVTLSLAAAILLMAWAGNLWLPTPNASKKGPEVVQKLPDVKQESAPLAESVDEAQQVVASLTNRVADKTMEQARLFWNAAAPAVDVPPMPQVQADPLDPATQPLRDAGAGVSAGLQTVTSNARRAVDYFKKELAFLDTAVNN